MDKIKYVLKQNSINPESFSYMHDYLISIGVPRENVRSFLMRPTEDDNEDFRKLKNIEKLIDALHDAFEADKNFFLQVDSDADGITSSAIFYSYFKTLYPNAKIEWRIHEVKEHGVILNTVPITADVIIIPDAGSNDEDINRTLSEQGRTVLIMDHHLCDNEPDFENVILVNNQTSPLYQNKALSGAGVVYKVISAYSEKYGDGESHKNYMDLAAIGIISDMMDTREVDNQYLIYNGLKNIKNPMLKALINKQEYSLSNQGKLMNPTKIDVAFYISPLINANIRYGSMEEKELMFRAFIEYDSKKLIYSTWRGNERAETLYDNATRICSNVRERQNRKKEKSMKALVDRIEKDKLYENQIIIVKTGKEEVPQNITGLVAMEISKLYGLPTLVLRPKKEGGVQYYAGSGRAPHTFGFESFRNSIRDTEISEFAEGHDMAFGTMIAEEDLPKFLDAMNVSLKDIDFSITQTEVDYIFKNKINKIILKEFAEHDDLYGNAIPEPKFAFELVVDTDYIRVIGAKGNTIRINHGGITFIKFRDAELAAEIDAIQSPRVKMTAIGRAQINEFNGNRSVQVILDAIELKEEERKALF